MGRRLLNSVPLWNYIHILDAGVNSMTKPTTLRTDRLVLRPYRLSDVVEVYGYAQDPEWGRYLPIPKPYELRHAEEFVARSVLTEWNTRPVFAVCSGGSVIGGINVRVDARSSTAEMGYGIAREHWGKGLAREAARAVIEWAFSEFALAKISARADLSNTQSWRVMEKLGMRREGILRSELPNPSVPDSRVDMVVYAILREEWLWWATEWADARS